MNFFRGMFDDNNMVPQNQFSNQWTPTMNQFIMHPSENFQNHIPNNRGLYQQLIMNSCENYCNNMPNNTDFNQFFGNNPCDNYQYQNQMRNQWTNTLDVYQSPNIKRPNGTRKRARENDYEDVQHVQKRQRLNASSVQYAIKTPSQCAYPMRKTLEKLFSPAITADGWEKNDEVFQYRTQILGTNFFEFGDTIENARELVAETALRALSNFKYEKISWPKNLLSFRLNQDFADEIERFVEVV